MFHLPARSLTPATRRYRQEGIVFPSAPDLSRYAPPSEEPLFDISPSASFTSLSSFEYTTSPASISSSSSQLDTSWQYYGSTSDGCTSFRASDRVKAISGCATSSHSLRPSKSSPDLEKTNPLDASPAAIHRCAICCKPNADVQVNITWADGWRSHKKSSSLGDRRITNHERIEQRMGRVQSIKSQSSHRFRDEASAFVCETCWNIWLARRRAEMSRGLNIVEPKEKEQPSLKRDRKPAVEKTKESKKKACPDERSKTWRWPFRFP